jgi:hypothetical protein
MWILGYYLEIAYDCLSVVRCGWESEDRERRNRTIRDNFNEYFSIGTNSTTPSTVKCTVSTPVPQDYKESYEHYIRRTYKTEPECSLSSQAIKNSSVRASLQNNPYYWEVLGAGMIVEEEGFSCVGRYLILTAIS